ncbi:MAG: Co-chaperonin GroES, chaperonin GroES [Candidatus Peregrinibacteria bacterium GW2011_GWE2_39_6]|nr:MAG: Co-chaperonin GroES, chaperonin GroES [Candidatus Peregrinibacteria bacterium GW2011_GWF2_39_17]KKR24073.1 MAG: Co-chaperonin GroES, chaperonin GroES [Candidatus Peregrinibacteria bacterium GW2011_GWE2_39_6]HCW32070.1 co-chaperone GroES [Candidatus Peregrinibacteria bacterium]
MNIKPLHDGLVVKRIKKDAQTPSGIVLPETAQEKPQEGEVLAVGPGKVDNNGKIIAMAVKVGDKILFTKYGPTEIKHEGEELLFLNESDVLAIFS